MMPKKWEKRTIKSSACVPLTWAFAWLFTLTYLVIILLKERRKTQALPELDQLCINPIILFK
jgi:hypothetical protein